MAKKNALLEKQRMANQAYFHAGLQSGRQQILDMMSVVLNDPQVMGKDTFGRKRLLSVLNAIGERIDEFQSAWEKNDETDYYRVKLDEYLTQIYGEDLADTFENRYEFCPEYNYAKGRWS